MNMIEIQDMATVILNKYYHSRMQDGTNRDTILEEISS